MNIVVIVDNADGNDSVGTAWKETKIFKDDQKISDVIDWVATIGTPFKRNIVITVPN
jgi:hypothetical protein